jgi:hypothetical protein
VRKNPAGTSTWLPDDDFLYEGAYPSQAAALLVSASGNIFAAGFSVQQKAPSYHWIVRKQ